MKYGTRNDSVTPKEAAQKLDGAEYGEEGSRELFAAMKAAGLVAVFGASDDLMEIRGAVLDEFYTTVYFTRNGMLYNLCEDDDCPYFEAKRARAAAVEPLWSAEPGWMWTYKTDIPHETFRVFDDGELYCRGIVFALSDVPEE